MTKLTYEERQAIKLKRDEHVRANMPKQYRVGRHYVPSTNGVPKSKEEHAEAKKRSKSRETIRRLARTGLKFSETDSQMIECVHCCKVSYKSTAFKLRHNYKCPQTPIEPQYPAHLTKRTL